MTKKPTYEELEKRIREFETKPPNFSPAHDTRFSEREESYRNLIEHLPGIVYRVFIKENNRMEFFTDMLFPMTGYTVDELETGEVCSIEPLILPEDRSIIAAAVKNAISEDEPFEVEYRLRKKDGEIVYFSERGRHVKEPEGEPIYIDGVILDITAQKNAEQALRETHDELERRVEERTAELSRAISELKQEIEERKRVVESLRKSEEKFQKLFQASPGWMAFTSLNDGRYIEVNDAFTRVTGFQRDDVIGRNAIEIGLWENPDDRTGFVQLAQEKGGLREQEVVFLKKNGEPITVLWSADVIDLAGEPCLLSSLIDITRRKEAEQALLESEEQLRLITDNLPVLIAYMDSDLRYRFNNKTYEDWLGQSREEICGKHLKDILGNETFERIKPHAHRALLGQKVNYETIVPTETGQGRFVNTSLIPHVGEEGEVKGLFTLVTDITERKQYEAALKESELKYKELYDESKRAEEVYRSLLHTSADAIVIYDMEGITQYVNPSFTEIFGWHLDELEGKRIPFVPESERKATMAGIKRIIDHGESIQGFETKRFRKDGRVINVSISGSRYNDHEGKPAGMLVVMRDTTEKRNLEIQLRQAQKLEAIGTLAGGIAHDFNNILGIIVGNAELAVDDIPEWNPARHNLEEVRKACLRGRDVVRQILSFSRQSDQKRKPVKLAPIIKDSLKLLRSSIPTTIEIRFNAVSESDTVNADPTQINQVLLNLCTNAAHAMHEKGGLLEVILEDFKASYEVDAQLLGLGSGDYIKLTVRDTGPGIKTEHLSRVFDPYFTTKDVGEGSGLGLSVARGIIEKHGGVITVMSEPEKGATFNIVFPTIEIEVESESETPELLPKGDERILFVDDEKAMVEALHPMLEKLGYTVSSKTSSNEALQTFKDNPDAFDLVVTDMTMPDMTGVELAEEILAVRPDTPIILCTGFSDKIDKERAQAIGVRMLVMKPVVMSELAKTIRKVLGK